MRAVLKVAPRDNAARPVHHLPGASTLVWACCLYLYLPGPTAGARSLFVFCPGAENEGRGGPGVGPGLHQDQERRRTCESKSSQVNSTAIFLSERKVCVMRSARVRALSAVQMEMLITLP